MKQFDVFEELASSPTLAQIHGMAKMLNVNIGNPDDVRGAFASTGIELIRAIDQGRIEFNDDLAKAMLLGLLAVTTDFLVEGRLKTISNLH